MSTAKPYVSIIIPTLNRAHLIGETLDSIRAQTYTHWECIVVDDGSTDETKSVVMSYCDTDARFKYVERPSNRPKGGNAARNYGFEISKGDFIQWFDSDDLMVASKLELKVNSFKEHSVDFVVSKTKYFNKENISFKNYEFKKKDVTFLNYAIGTVNWFTPDLILKRSVASQISYNELLRAGQEYNLNCKLLLKTTNMFYLEEFLTLRRAHDDSIGQTRRKQQSSYLKTKFEQHWLTYCDVHESAASDAFDRYSLLKCVICYYKSKNTIALPQRFKQQISRVFKSKSIYFTLGQFSNRFFKKYYFFYNQLKK
ncbi:glycosyltransferase family 2 protein [Rasiella rasia]|uniref:Glycosyltransferase family 2 protein n=1 Tax=Rasiella rasia TaxID=2744027 RepID=A0A6G6GQ77_9FLAO|nr:glycosyltransferase family 2 protein [Rasiella rasia]QIE60620.1 glycosyltransferase family 2 protein [Rasiella rasia]